MLSLKTLTAVNKVIPARTLLKLKKNQPEIMLAGGIVCGIGTVVWASYATLKAQAVMSEADEKFEMIEAAQALESESYTEEDVTRDKFVATVQTLVGLGRLYAGPVALGTLSLGLILGSHNILTKRNTALVGAYTLLNQGFKEYRQRVVALEGPEKDQQYRYGFSPEGESCQVSLKTKNKEEAKPEDVGVDKLPDCMVVAGTSIYARWFDEENRYWQNDMGTNIFFLRSQQNYSNDMLRLRGHIFLNEIYDMLGLPRTKEGAIVGWVAGHGDGFVDFGIMNPEIKENRDAVNGYVSPRILIDPNVDGVIFDMI